MRSVQIKIIKMGGRMVRHLEAELRKVQAETANLYKAIGDGIPTTQLKQPLDQKLARQSEIKNLLASLKSNTTNAKSKPLSREMVMQYIGWAWERLQSEDVVSQKAFLTESIQRIEVGGKRVSMH